MGLFGEVLDTAVGSDQAEEQVTEGMSLKGLSCVDPSWLSLYEWATLLQNIHDAGLY